MVWAEGRKSLDYHREAPRVIDFSGKSYTYGPSAYRVIQIGANTQSGGVNEGLANSWYQSWTAVRVTTPPIADTARQSARKPPKLAMF